MASMMWPPLSEAARGRRPKKKAVCGRCLPLPTHAEEHHGKADAQQSIDKANCALQMFRSLRPLRVSLPRGVTSRLFSEGALCRYCSWVKTKYANQVEAGEGMTPQFRALGSYLQGVQVPSAPMRSPAGKAQTGFNKAAQVQAAKAAQAAQCGPLGDGQWLMSFGKHQGLSFAEVYSKDRGYCEYMVDQVLTRDGKAGSNYCHQPGPGQRPNQANVSGCAFATYVLYNALQEVMQQTSAK
eukprot:g12850.t1